MDLSCKQPLDGRCVATLWRCLARRTSAAAALRLGVADILRGLLDEQCDAAKRRQTVASTSPNLEEAYGKGATRKTRATD